MPPTHGFLGERMGNQQKNSSANTIKTFLHSRKPTLTTIIPQKEHVLYEYASDFVQQPVQIGQRKGKGKGKGKGKSGATWGHAGVGFCIASKVANAIKVIY